VAGSPSSVAVGDINLDGLPDIVTANLTGASFTVLLNGTALGTTGSVTFGAPQSHNTNPSPVAVAVCDMNGDGKPDVVVTTVSNGGSGGTGAVTVFINATAPNSPDASAAHRRPSIDVATDRRGVRCRRIDEDGDGSGATGTAITHGCDNDIRLAVAIHIAHGHRNRRWVGVVALRRTKRHRTVVPNAVPFSRTVKLAPVRLAVTISGSPSKLISPTATDEGDPARHTIPRA